MKKLIFLISFFISLNEALAQCSGCTITVSSSISTTISIGAGDVLCFTGGTFSGNISLTSSGATICVATGATISSASNLSFGGQNVTIDNYGSWEEQIILGGSSVFNNHGNYGTAATPISLGLNPNATFNNLAGADAFISNLNMNNGTTFNGYGQTTVTNGFAINTGSSLNIFAGGSFTQTSTSDVNVNSGGVINVAAGASFSTAGNLTNSGDMNVAGTMDIGGNFTINGSGTLNVTNTMVNVTGNVTNNGSINAMGICGGIMYGGSATQNGSGVTQGAGGATADICGGSSSTTYDINTGTNTNISSPECSCITTLNVKLLKFTVQVDRKSKINKIYVQYADSTEYIIEKSADGRNFETLQALKGSIGNIIDQNPFKVTYYRILKDNTYSFVIVACQHDAIDVVLADNPTYTNTIKYKILGIEDKRGVEIKLYSLQGEIQIERQDFVLNNTFSEIPLGSLPKGAYLLRLYIPQENQIFTKKIILR